MKMKYKKILSFICAFLMLFTTLFSDLCLISSEVYAAVAEDGTVAINADVDSEESTTEELYFEEAQEEFVEDTTAPEFTIDYNEEETSDSVEVIISISEDTDDVDTVVVTNLEEEEIEVASNNDGTYSFIASENDTYVVTVSDFSGNSSDKEVTIDNIISEETEEVVTEEISKEELVSGDEVGEETVLLSSSTNGIVLTASNSYTVQYLGHESWEGHTCGHFMVDGKIAFCMEHEKNTPSTGTAVTSSVYDNENIAKCLYYGWEGDGQWSGFTSESMGIVVTSLALNYFYVGDTSSNTYNDIKSFVTYVKSQSLPEKRLSFSNSNLSVSIDGDKQVSETSTLEGNSNYSISFALQDGVRLVNVTKGTEYTGTATLWGGDAFYLYTYLSDNVTGTWTSQSITGTVYKFSALKYVSSSSSVQDLAGSAGWIADSDKYIDLTVDWVNTGSLTIQKENSKGDLVSGSKFRVWSDDTDYDETVTVTNGSVTEELLPRNLFRTRNNCS